MGENLLPGACIAIAVAFAGWMANRWWHEQDGFRALAALILPVPALLSIILLGYQFGAHDAAREARFQSSARDATVIQAVGQAMRTNDPDQLREQVWAALAQEPLSLPEPGFPLWFWFCLILAVGVPCVLSVVNSERLRRGAAAGGKGDQQQDTESQDPRP